MSDLLRVNADRFGVARSRRCVIVQVVFAPTARSRRGVIEHDRSLVRNVFMDFRLEKLKAIVASAVEGISGEQLRWHLPGKWCAEEVLEHLYLTYAGTIKGFERVISCGKPLATRASMAQRALTFVVVGLGHMPAGLESPAVARPRGLPAEQVRTEIWATLVAMDAIIAQCEARFGRQAKLLDHPMLGPLTATQWRKLHLVHGRHHQKQLLRLRQTQRGKSAERTQARSSQ